ncbi:MAG: HYR domain-containing protein [Bacteroidia bacterium]
MDVTPPVAVCQNVTVALNTGGTGSTTAAAVNNGSTDNCGIVSMVASTAAFSCPNVRSRPVTLTLSDATGNTATCSATVTVQDLVAPTTPIAKT